MEPPLKKRRVGFKNSPHDLQLKRARNDQRLKSRFEAIFEKFGKDFSGVGDEIDLETGKIVVDNGHLNSMRDEQDIGTVEQAGTDPIFHTSRAAEHPETEKLNNRILHRSANLVGTPKANLMDHADTVDIARAVMSLNGDLLSSPSHSLERNLLRRGTASDSSSHGDKLHDPKQCFVYEVEENVVDPKWQVPFVPQSHSSRQVELEDESEDEGRADSGSSRSMSPPGQSLWATPSYVRKGRQRVVWSAEVKSFLTKASSCMLKDIITPVEAIDQGKRQSKHPSTSETAFPDETSTLPQSEISLSLEEFNHDIHAHPKRLSNGYWEKKIPDEDVRRRFVRHLYNKRAYMKRLERERGHNRRSNDTSDDLDASEVAVGEELLTPTGQMTFSLPVEHSRTQSSLDRSSPPVSTRWKDLTCTEDEVMFNGLNKPGAKARERTPGLLDSEHYEQSNMPISKASSMLSVREVAKSMQVYRADYTCATSPHSGEIENVLEEAHSEDAAFFMADVERESESASNIELNQIFDINASLTPCGPVKAEQPSAVARVVSNRPEEPSTSLQHGNTRTKEPKHKPKIMQRLERKSVPKSKLSPQRAGCFVTPTASPWSLLNSRMAKNQNMKITRSPLQSVTRIDVSSSDPRPPSKRSSEVVDDLEDILTYASPISLHPTKNTTLLGQAISTSPKSKTKRKRSAISIGKRPSFYSLHGDCSDDELVMSHDPGSGLTPISKGQGKTRKDGIPVFNRGYS